MKDEYRDKELERYDLNGKYAIVTGSTQGLGEAITRLFIARGISGVLICGRNAERGKSLVAELSTSQCAVHFVQVDLSHIEDCHKIVATAKEQFGHIDILVNAAGYTGRGSIWDTNPEVWDTHMAVNVRAPFFLMQECITHMKTSGIAGAIVNIGSLESYGSVDFLCPYAASKGALVTLTKNIAYAVMRYRIRINTLNIGWMDTPGEHETQKRFHGADDDWLEKVEAEQPFGRLLKPREVAEAVAFLASDASGMMTGSIVDFDQSVIGAGPHPIPPKD